MPVITEPIEKIATAGGGGGGFPGDYGGGFGRGGGGRGDGGRSGRIYRTGVWIALVPILMLFVGFGSAYIVRRGLSSDWETLELPAIVWLNTLFLLASSLTLERARRCLSWGLRDDFNQWWSATTALGVAFLLGQLAAWWQLRARGVYLASNPSSSFFYLLTAAHGVHLLGGVCALLYVVFQAVRVGVGPTRRTAVDVTAIYWHFLGGLWASIFLLLIIWR